MGLMETNIKRLRKSMDDNKNLESKVAGFIEELVPDYKQNADMVDTPKRVAKMYKHFFRNQTDEIEEMMSKTFPTANDQMVIVKDIKCFGLCPHHLMPIEYKVHIGYIPNGKALGLSKFGRLAIACASYPKLQENMTTEIAETLEKYLKPKGVMVVVSGVHGCMKFRGVEMDSATVTSDCRGDFRDDLNARQEFLKLLEK